MFVRCLYIILLIITLHAPTSVHAAPQNISQQQQINLEDIYAEQVPRSEESYEQSQGAGAGVELVELNTAEF
jgi:hypothetical protein